MKSRRKKAYTLAENILLVQKLQVVALRKMFDSGRIA